MSVLVKSMQKPQATLPPIRYELHRAMARTQPGRSMLNLHASDFTKSFGFCPRERAFYLLDGSPPPDEFVSTGDEVTWHIGRVIQEHNNQAFAHLGMAVGNWRCRLCGHGVVFQKMPASCAKCAGKNFRYEEFRFQSAKSGMSCGVDLALDRGTGKLWVIEQKTLNKIDFKTLSAPQQEHAFRTRMYLRIIAESAQPQAQQMHLAEAIILYTAKDGYVADAQAGQLGFRDSPYSPFKEYVVQRRDQDSDAMMAQSEKAWRFMQDGTMPDGVCSVPTAKKAKYCKKAGKCFGGNYPAGEKAPGWPGVFK